MILKHWKKVCSDPETYVLSVPGTGVGCDATNCFAVCDEGEWLVIDTGMNTQEGKELLRAALECLGARKGEVSFFLTHSHADHAGLIGAVSDWASRVYLGKPECDILGEGPMSRDEYLSLAVTEGFSTDEALVFAEIHETLRSELEGLSNLVPVEDGDVIALGSRELIAMATPGHSSGHFALHDPSSGVVFSGDLVLRDVAPYIDVFPDGGDSLQAYLESLAKLRALNPSMLLCAHGDEAFDALSRIDWLLDHHKDRLNEAACAVSTKPGLTGAEIVKSMTWGPLTSTWEAVPPLLRAFIICEGMSALTHLSKAGVIGRHLGSGGIYRYAA